MEEGVKKNENITDLKGIQPKFEERSKEKYSVYQESVSKVGVSSFQPIQEARSPTEIYSSVSYLYRSKYFHPTLAKDS